jgi:hypothetical protein
MVDQQGITLGAFPNLIAPDELHAAIFIATLCFPSPWVASVHR